jgi:hypothetical protein
MVFPESPSRKLYRKKIPEIVKMVPMVPGTQRTRGEGYGGKRLIEIFKKSIDLFFRAIDLIIKSNDISFISIVPTSIYA